MKKKNNSLLIFSIALIASSLIIGGSIIYSAQSNGNDQMWLTDDYGNVYAIEKEEPVKLTIITDAKCEACKTDQMEVWLKGQIGMPFAVRRLEFSDPEGMKIIAENNAEFLPYFLIDNSIEKLSRFTHLSHHVVTKSNESYYVDLVKMGATIGRYLDASYYAKDDPNAPKIVAIQKEFDFGTVPLSGGKVSTEFVVKNEGKSPLEFLNANTSCGCTSAQIELANEASPEYKMAGHGEPVKWRGSLAPGETGKIIVHYDPSIHPDLNGSVTREVMIDTNDPNTPQLKLKIHANQISS